MNTRNNDLWVHLFAEGENKRTFANMIAKQKATVNDSTCYPVPVDTRLFLSDTDMFKDKHISMENVRWILSWFFNGEVKLETKLIEYMELTLFHYHALPIGERRKFVNKGYALEGHVMAMVENILSLILQIDMAIKSLHKDNGVSTEVMREFLFTMNRTYPDLISLQRKLNDLWRFVSKEYQKRAEKAV